MPAAYAQVSDGWLCYRWPRLPWTSHNKRLPKVPAVGIVCGGEMIPAVIPWPTKHKHRPLDYRWGWISLLVPSACCRPLVVCNWKGAKGSIRLGSGMLLLVTLNSSDISQLVVVQISDISQENVSWSGNDELVTISVKIRRKSSLRTSASNWEVTRAWYKCVLEVERFLT